MGARHEEEWSSMHAEETGIGSFLGLAMQRGDASHATERRHAMEHADLSNEVGLRPT
jgi:hypothetical protein